jgi:hypothetical protein
LDDIKTDPHPSAELGTVVHDRLAKWLSTGEALDLDEEYQTKDGRSHYPGRIAAAGLKHLPIPEPSLDVERQIDLKTDFADFIGFVDLAFVEDGLGHVVLDHKTTSDFKWAKTEDDLRSDVQAAIYAAHRMWLHNLDEVTLRWVYYRTRGKPKAQKVELTVLREDVESAFVPIREAAREMCAAKEDGLKALDLEPSPAACDMYGGCAYQSHCNLQPIEKVKASMAKSRLAEQMKARLQAKANGTAEKPPDKPEGINPPEAATAPEPVNVAPPAEDKPPKKKRGRPSKKTEEAPATAPAAVVNGKGFALYVNCKPIKGGRPCITARVLAWPSIKAVEKEHGVADYRLVEYARGPAAVVAHLAESLAQHPPAGVSVTLNMRTDEAHFLSLLEELATEVVYGV